MLVLIVGFTTVNPIETKADSASPKTSSETDSSAKPTHDLNAVAYGKTVQNELEARYARYGAIQKKSAAKPKAVQVSEENPVPADTEKANRWSFRKLFGGDSNNETTAADKTTPATKAAIAEKTKTIPTTAKAKKPVLFASAANEIAATKTASTKTENKRVPLFTGLSGKSTEEKSISTKSVPESQPQTKQLTKSTSTRQAQTKPVAEKPDAAVLNELSKLYEQHGGKMPEMHLSAYPKSNPAAQHQAQAGKPQQAQTTHNDIIQTSETKPTTQAESISVAENPEPSLLERLFSPSNKNEKADSQSKSITRKPLFSFRKSKANDKAYQVAEPRDPKASTIIRQRTVTNKNVQLQQKAAPQPITDSQINHLENKRKPLFGSNSSPSSKPAHPVARQAEKTEAVEKPGEQPGLLSRLGLFRNRNKSEYPDIPPEPVEPPKKIAKQTGIKPAPPAPDIAPAPAAVDPLEDIPELQIISEKPAANPKATTPKATKPQTPVAAAKPAGNESVETPVTGLILEETTPAAPADKPEVKTVSGNKPEQDTEYYKLPQIRPKHDDHQADSQRDKMQLIAERKEANGLKGFCPVVLRDERNLTDAKPLFHSKYKGNMYYFSSAVAKLKFDQQPEKYAPAAGGHDVVINKTNAGQVPGSLDHAVWFRDRLFLFSSQANKAAFVADPSQFIE